MYLNTYLLEGRPHNKFIIVTVLSGVNRIILFIMNAMRCIQQKEGKEKDRDTVQPETKTSFS